MSDDQPQSLRDTDTGRWVVTTASGSRYDIDLGARCVVRVPDSGSVPMRRDGSVTRLIAVERCAIGERAVLHLDGVAEPLAEGVDYSAEVVSTTRVTTPVVSIQPVGQHSNTPPLE